MDFLDWARKNSLPKALKTRAGWARLFEHHRFDVPHIHQIEPTNFCSYSCMMCPREKHMVRDVGYMDLSVYKKIIEEIAGYPEPIRSKEIELFHFGESLFHPDIIEMVDMASVRGLHPVLSVNPAILSEDQIKQLPRANPAKIILSLDSLDSEKFKMIRGPEADLGKALFNIERILEQCGQDHIEVVVRMIVMDCNRREVDAFQAFWQGKNCRIELRDFFPWNSKDYQDLSAFPKYPAGMACPFPWQYMVVHWNGDVVPCCRDHSGLLVLGNVKENSLSDIWKSEKYNQFRETMVEGKGLHPMCSECLEMYCS